VAKVIAPGDPLRRRAAADLTEHLAGRLLASPFAWETRRHPISLTSNEELEAVLSMSKWAKSS
jgi:hypothetical protein